MTHVETITSVAKLSLRLVKSSLCDYSDAYILVKRTIIIPSNPGPLAGRTEAQIQTAIENNEGNKGLIFKSYAPFSDCISKSNNTKRDNAKDIDVVMSMCNLI